MVGAAVFVGGAGVVGDEGRRLGGRRGRPAGTGRGDEDAEGAADVRAGQRVGAGVCAGDAGAGAAGRRRSGATGGRSRWGRRSRVPSVAVSSRPLIAVPVISRKPGVGGRRRLDLGGGGRTWRPWSRWRLPAVTTNSQRAGDVGVGERVGARGRRPAGRCSSDRPRRSAATGGSKVVGDPVQRAERGGQRLAGDGCAADRRRRGCSRGASGASATTGDGSEVAETQCTGTGRRDEHAQRAADVRAGQRVGPAARAGDVRAGSAGGVAAAPLVGEAVRVAGPDAVGHGEFPAVDRRAADRRKGDIRGRCGQDLGGDVRRLPPSSR